jgi:microcystin-dependent protein
MSRSSVVSNGQYGFSQQYNTLRADSYGASQLLVHQTFGFFSLGTNPTNTHTLTLTINGTAVVFTFVSSIGSTAGNVLIGASAAATAANLIALLQQPQTTTSTGVALSTANQQLVSYLSFLLVTTTLYVSSNNTTAYAPQTSFSASTTATSNTWTSNTMAYVVEPGTTTIAGTIVKYAGGITPTITAPSSHPRIDLVTINSSGTIVMVTGVENASPAVPTYPSGSTTLCEVYNVTGETALYDNANQTAAQGYIKNDSRPFMNVTQIVQSGLIMMWPVAPVPTGWLSCDGSAVSRATYPTLFGIVAPVFGTITVTIASPAVVSAAAHGLQVGDQVFFTTSGALPTGITANTLYYVISAGYGANAFEISATRGGSAVNTSGTQSGTHTMTVCFFGLGDGSTTFNLPDMRANVPAGYKAADTNMGYYGQSGGEATHTLTTGEMPSHTHNITTYDATGSGNTLARVEKAADSAGSVATGTGSIANTGSGSAHNNLAPFLTLVFIIKT